MRRVEKGGKGAGERINRLLRLRAKETLQRAQALPPTRTDHAPPSITARYERKINKIGGSLNDYTYSATLTCTEATRFRPLRLA